ncbi:tRNA (adenosine(37)-N6)-threonylcarbamoyltransferase complex dimerization subunit type 1 TsaB [Terrilactibacillus laevilacticus]|uniref:tRNA (Adenosine(37)-N6)-threonylcarbamoyltransferase complex dimerization subunit type 1 TsaB n=1 Tax=Terrilactibacillus laevilacticus TaxID=1380157 RepID=A0ABW5PS56_9BACI|nr:tRNA (adenosine(37)-N6)-threonylcarbamoyltransferase complex dimerization subunit type 1 TsaB [Terrilactibacillus laevilacticus]
MNILAIDSSNLVMGVAVSTETKVLGEIITNVKKNHSIRLMPAIEQIIRDVDLTLDQIDRIAVAIGPGSYTGVRIGVTIAKTLAWTANKEIVGVSSLEALAQNGIHFNGLIVPFFDARRGQVYTGLYQSKDGKVECVQEDRLTMMKDWLAELKKCQESILFLSNDFDKHEALIQEILPNSVIGEAVYNNPRPSEIAKLAFTREPSKDVHHVVPSYLRLAEAESKWLEKQVNKK